MAVPNIDDSYVHHNEGGGVGVGEAIVRSKRRMLFFNPFGIWLYRWMGVVTLAALYNAFLIIVRETFDKLLNSYLPLWLTLDYIADTVYVLDMAVQLCTSHLEQGLLVTEPKQMALRYVKSMYFKLDLLSLIPFDFLYLIPGVGPGRVIVRLNRLLRTHCMVQFFSQTESRTNFPNLFRVFMLVMYIFLIIHWNACFYFLISEAIRLASDSWVYPGVSGINITGTPFASISRKYLVSLYWSTLTLTTIGEVPGPVSDWEYVFVIFDFLVGVLIFATIVGMVGGIITNMNIRRTEFQAQLDNSTCGTGMWGETCRPALSSGLTISGPTTTHWMNRRASSLCQTSSRLRLPSMYMYTLRHCGRCRSLRSVRRGFWRSWFSN